MTAASGMWTYYWRLLERWPHVFRHAWERIGFVVDVLIAVLLLFNQTVAQEVAGQRGFSAWWFLLPLAALFVYGVAKANWEQHNEIVGRLATEASQVRSSLASNQTFLQEARKHVAAYEERLRPKLRLVFGGRVPTYYQESLVIDRSGATLNDRLFRVGVVNDSSAVIKDVQVLLEGCSSPGGEPVYLKHRLGIMGRKEDTVDVPPGSEPSVYADVVEQQELTNAPPGPIFICYSTLNLRAPLSPISRTMTLVAQGGGTEGKINLQVMRGSDNRLQVIQLA
jgi:hypothetical protein